MDIKQIVNTKGKAVAAPLLANPDFQLLQTLRRASNQPMSMSDAGSGRGNSPHESEHSRYSSPGFIGQLNGTNGGDPMRYPSPTAMQTPLPMLQQSFQHNNGFSNGVPMQQEAPQPRQADNTPKAFPCSTCGKGFARRSDLARHERIHSGVRPHVCEYPGCGKQFIQRSALTVHNRVHTGEKPHMCERCGKPFSDSSSLARHRRIHSGKRPYKCPYADCQKTFTRRTTLTRHQNNHTGTVEDAAAATAAALATRSGSVRNGGRQRSDGEQYSNTGSPMSTPSPNMRAMTASPANSELAPMNNMHRHPDQFAYMHNSSLPGHLRGEYNLPSQAPPTSGAYQQSQGMRPTSHPTSYGPPPSILEPPAQHSGGSASGSPHMSNSGWASPSQSIPSPSNNGYVYPDPDPSYISANMGQPMFYQNSNIRRTESTEPDSFDMKPRMNIHNQHQGEMWASAQ